MVVVITNRCTEEERITIVIGTVLVSTLLDEILHHVQVAVLSSTMKGITISAGIVEVCPLLDEKFRRLKVAILNCFEKCLIYIRPLFDKELCHLPMAIFASKR